MYLDPISRSQALVQNLHIAPLQCVYFVLQIVQVGLKFPSRRAQTVKSFFAYLSDPRVFNGI